MAASRKKPPGANTSRIRVFKDVDFAKAATNAGITDTELCTKAAQLINGIGGENLGGNVWKVRLRNNDFRALVLEINGAWLVYAYLYDKQDEKNVATKTLKAFKLLAKSWKAMSQKSFNEMVTKGYLVEICRHE